MRGDRPLALPGRAVLVLEVPIRASPLFGDVSGEQLLDGDADLLVPRSLMEGCAFRPAQYVAFLHPAFGTALLVGAGVVTLLHLLLRP
ncbi:hypothetical protein AB0L35_10550 [Streptomyces sp. NPDC052309]|uniref:hypothetical protein n=1 Tax=Streptomyces sp. NPDC052309 TaxID=3155421 RepID=UPI00341DDCC7